MATCMLCKAFLFVASSGCALLLHGCGGGGDDSTTTTTITTTTTTTTKLIIPSRSKPMTSKEAADYLNKLYTGFDASDSSSPLGVTLSMTAQDTSFFANIYCSLFVNPVTNEKTGCFNGQADCRLSTALLGSQWMINSEADRRVASFGKRSVGFVFNQTMVESKWTKCSFIWDGASANRYNRGCGNGAPGNSCDNQGEAFYDICPSTNSVCTADSQEVQVAICDAAGGTLPVPDTHDGKAQCIFPGVALDYHGQADYKEGKDFTREMAKQRLKYNSGRDQSGPNIEKNNEVVLDEELLVPDLWQDPVAAMPAFVYSKSNAKISRKNVETMRNEYCQHYYCEHNGGGLVPLVQIDDLQYHAGGPFLVDGEEEEKSTVVV